MFALNPVSPGTGGQWDNLQPSLWEAAGAKWRLGRSEDSAMAHYEQWLETWKEGSREIDGIQLREEKLPPEELNKKYALPGLEYSIPEYEHIAALRHEKHKALMTDRAIAAAAPVFSSAVGAPSFLVGMLGSMTRPLDFGVQLLLPGVGGEIALGRKVAMDGALKFAENPGFLSAASRFAPLAERGIIPRAAVPFVEQFPRLAPSIANNLIQQAILEVPIKLHDIQTEGSPDLVASAVNMVTGAAFAEGVRIAAHYAVRLGAGFHKAAMERAVADMHAGRDVDVSQELAVHSVSEEANARVVREDVEAASPRAEQRAAEIVSESLSEHPSDSVGWRDLPEEAQHQHAKLAEEQKAVVREEVAKQTKEIARSEGISVEEATRRARNKVEGELGALFRQAFKQVSEEGNIGHATPEATLAIAEALVKGGDPADIHVRQVRSAVSLIRQIESGADVLLAGANKEKAIQSRVKTLGEMLGIKVQKTGKGLPQGGRLVVLPTAEKGLEGIVNAELVKNSDLFTSLGDSVVDRANRLKSKLNEVVQERIKALVEANKDVRIEDGRVVTPKDDEIRARQLEESTPDPEAVAEMERVTTDEDLIREQNAEMERELGELNAEEQAALDSVKEHFDLGNEEKIAKSAADCIIENG